MTKNALSIYLDGAFCRSFKAVSILLFLLDGVHRFISSNQEQTRRQSILRIPGDTDRRRNLHRRCVKEEGIIQAKKNVFSVDDRLRATASSEKNPCSV